MLSSRGTCERGALSAVASTSKSDTGSRGRRGRPVMKGEEKTSRVSAMTISPTSIRGDGVSHGRRGRLCNWSWLLSSIYEQRRTNNVHDP